MKKVFLILSLFIALATAEEAKRVPMGEVVDHELVNTDDGGYGRKVITSVDTLILDEAYVGLAKGDIAFLVVFIDGVRMLCPEYGYECYEVYTSDN